MELRIVVDASLEVDASEFEQAWNATPECTDLATASAIDAPPGRYGDLGSLGMVATVALSVATSVAAAALYDAIKQRASEVLKRKGVRRELEFKQYEEDSEGRREVTIRIVEKR